MKVQNKGFVMLEGSLETFPLSSVVRLIDDSAATGRLSVQAALGTGSLTFDGGRLVDAVPAPGGDPIEGALALFDHRSGRFSFRPEAVSERTVDLDVKSLLELVEERREAWERLRQVVPAEATLSLLPERRIDGMVTVSAQAWRVALLAGGRTPAGLAVACGMTEFSVCTILVELLEQGLLVSLSHQAGTGETHPGGARASRARPQVAHVAPEVEPEPERLYPPEAGPETELEASDLLRELGGDEPARPQPRKRR